MPTDSTSVLLWIYSCYERLKEDVLSFREKGKVVLLGDFNVRVGRSAQLDDVVGMFGENTCNAQWRIQGGVHGCRRPPLFWLATFNINRYILS